jgi:phospholipase C
MPRINRFIVLMLENRSFDHLFGFFQSPAGGTIENLRSLLSGGLESVEKPPATRGEAAAAIEAKLEAAGL